MNQTDKELYRSIDDQALDLAYELLKKNEDNYTLCVSKEGEDAIKAMFLSLNASYKGELLNGIPVKVDPELEGDKVHMKVNNEQE